MHKHVQYIDYLSMHHGVQECKFINRTFQQKQIATWPAIEHDEANALTAKVVSATQILSKAASELTDEKQMNVIYAVHTKHWHDMGWMSVC